MRRTDVATIAELTIGSESWTNARVALMPADSRTSDEFDGILGVDFLRRYAVGVPRQLQLDRTDLDRRLCLPPPMQPDLGQRHLLMALDQNEVVVFEERREAAVETAV